MRIALVGPTHPFRGGIAHYTTSLYRSLIADHEVILISFSRQYPSVLFPGKTQRDKSECGFSAPVEYCIDSMNPLTWRVAGRKIGSFGADVVVFQWWQPFFAFSYAGTIQHIKRLTDAPVLFLCHNIYPHERLGFGLGRAFESSLIRHAFRRVDGFLVHSNKMIDDVHRFRRGVPVRHIYHPVYNFYRRWEVDQPSSPSPRKNLLFFGKIRHYKGLEVFLRSLQWIDRAIDFEAVVAGEFYVPSAPYKRLTEELGIAGKVNWLDRYIPNDEVPRLFQRADLVVLPYLDATQSGVVPLAYEFDVPVVASDVGGLSEIVLHGETGYLFPAGDARALAYWVDFFFREDNARSFRANISRFKRELSWQQVVDNILAFVPRARPSREAWDEA